jgi:hypothetical protein
MKKFVSMFLILTMLLAMTACGSNETQNSDAAGSTEAATAPAPLEILTTVWNSYSEDEKFPAFSGDYTQEASDMPGSLNLEDENTTGILTSMLLVPEDSIALIDDVASLFHMMNTNTFTGGAYHLKDADTLTTFVNALAENIRTNPWMCGFPDSMLIVQIGNDTVVSAFGGEDQMTVFHEKLMAAYDGSATILIEESLAD